MPETVGFIGLGLIGLPAATNLIRAGFPVVGFGLDNLDKFAAAGGRPLESSRAVAQAATIIFQCLPDAAALDDAVYGPRGTLKGLRPGSVTIELGSYALDDKTRLRDALREAQAHLLDCELTARGGSAGMAERDCVILVSGERALADRMRPLLDAISRRVVYVGEFGTSLRLKLVNNLLVGVHVLAAAEAVALGVKAGFDPAVVVDVLSQGAGSSVMLERYGPDMAARVYDRELKGMIKTFYKYFDLIEDLAESCSAATPLLDTTADYFHRAIDAGLVTRDLAAVYEIIAAEPRKPA